MKFLKASRAPKSLTKVCLLLLSLTFHSFLTSTQAQANGLPALTQQLCESGLNPAISAQYYQLFLNGFVQKIQTMMGGFSYGAEGTLQAQTLEVRTRLLELHGISASQSLQGGMSQTSENPGWTPSSALPFHEMLTQFAMRRWYQALMALERQPSNEPAAQQYAYQSLEDFFACLELLRTALGNLYMELAKDPAANANAIANLTAIAGATRSGDELETSFRSFGRYLTSSVIGGLKGIGNPDLRRSQVVSIITGRAIPASEVATGGAQAITFDTTPVAGGFGAVTNVNRDRDSGTFGLDHSDRRALEIAGQHAERWIQTEGGATLSGVPKEVWDGATPLERIRLLSTAAASNPNLQGAMSTMARAAQAARASNNPLDAAAAVFSGKLDGTVSDFLSGLASGNSGSGLGSSVARPAAAAIPAAAPSVLHQTLATALDAALDKAEVKNPLVRLALKGALSQFMGALTAENLAHLQPILSGIIGAEKAETVVTFLRMQLPQATPGSAGR